MNLKGKKMALFDYSVKSLEYLVLHKGNQKNIEFSTSIKIL